MEHLTVFSVNLWLQRFPSTAAAVVHTLERYQEQPQLLDPYLPQRLDLLVQPIRCHLSLLAQQQHQQQSKHVGRGWQAAVSCCCVRMLLHLVYVHCKVRGTKEIRSLLPQEPELLEQVLSAASMPCSSVEVTTHHLQGWHKMQDEQQKQEQKQQQLQFV